MKRIKLFCDRKTGEAYYHGENSTISQRNGQSISLKGAERFLGPGARIIVYRASKTVARKRLYEMTGALKGADSDVMKKALEYLSMCGFGLFEIKNFGKETMIELRNSSNALKHRSDRPVCYITAGYLAGIMELITGRECICIEERCIAKGDRVCTFRIKVLHSKAESVKGWWKSKKPPGGVEETFVDYDEKNGEVLLKGITSSIVNARPELSELQKEFERIIGPANKTIRYNTGRGTTTEAVGQIQGFIIKVMRIFSRKKIIKKLLEQFPERGYGVAELLDFDEKRMTARIAVRNSYNAMGYGKTKEPVCHAVAGIFAGGGNVVFGISNMECRETKCIAKGDPHCEFYVYPERR
jgi:predicted hydrocarbon binding protein